MWKQGGASLDVDHHDRIHPRDHHNRLDSLTIPAQRCLRVEDDIAAPPNSPPCHTHPTLINLYERPHEAHTNTTTLTLKPIDALIKHDRPSKRVIKLMIGSFSPGCLECRAMVEEQCINVIDRIVTSF